MMPSGGIGIRKRMPEKSSLRQYQSPKRQTGSSLDRQRSPLPNARARPEILLGRAEVFPLQLRGYFRRLCIVIEKFLNGNWFYIAPLGYVVDQEKVSKRNLSDTAAGVEYWWLAQ